MMTAARLLAAAALVLGAAVAPAAAQKAIPVTIDLPVEARLDTTGVRRILIGGFLHTDYERFNVESELVRVLRNELRKGSDFLILTDPPVSLPEQQLDDLKRNAPFFQTIGDEYRADLIVTGKVQFGTVDRSGFAQEEYISPVTGRRAIRTRFVERTGFTLRLDLIFVKGGNGELVYETSFVQDEIVDADAADPLSMFYLLVERFQEGYLAILTPRKRTETRFLFEE